jgi:glutamine amidotransferase
LKIAVVDYGMGNLRSVSKALEHVAPAAESASPPTRKRSFLRQGRRARPGRHARLHAPARRKRRARAVVEAARAKPFLGICIGLQMLFERGEEGDTPGWGCSRRGPRFSVPG